MRALLFLLPVVLAGCATDSSFSVSQREILKRSQAEINQREPWSDKAAIFVTNPGDTGRNSWNVRAGAVDYTAYHPVYRGTYFVSGTERELRFTRDGCLTEYYYPGSNCAATSAANSSGMVMLPEK